MAGGFQSKFHCFKFCINFFFLFRVRRAEQFRVLYVQGEVQFVLEAVAARADRALVEDLRGRYAVTGVAVQEQQQQQQHVVLVTGLVGLLEQQRVVAGHVGPAAGAQYAVQAAGPSPSAAGAATIARRSAVTAPPVVATSAATSATGTAGTAVDGGRHADVHAAVAQPFWGWRLA